MLLDRKHNLTTQQPADGLGHHVSALFTRYRIEDGQPIILYAGTFERYQGLELLVDASPAVLWSRRNARFVCLGGNKGQIAAIKARAEERGVAGSFVLPGTVPPEDVETHFRIASMLVSPRISGTNTPLKIYSYLRSGVPILATNIRSHTQVLTPDVALLVDPRAEAIAAGILKLLDDSELSQRLARNALRLAQDRYSPEAYYEKVGQVFAFLAARSQRGM